MIARERGRDTALDRVAGALSNEAARTELYRYATSVAEAMPPDSSSWYVVGAVVQVNAVTRHELTTLAHESKRGGTILAGLQALVQWFPKAGAIAIVAAGSALACLFLSGAFIWHSAYDFGWNESRVQGYLPVGLQVCRSLRNVRHEMAMKRQRPALEAVQRELTSRGCTF